jgi:excinuclease ABC subunit B
MDPEIEVRSAKNQVDDLYGEILERVKAGERVLVTTLTKRMAEDLTDYYVDLGIRVRYLHADINTLERMEIIRELRLGHFDVLVGINLLREGLDLPEVSLVAILDADKEGFLRSARSLVQTCGRAARNVEGRVIMYADGLTASMRQAIDETRRRRKIQAAHNRRHHITPTTIRKEISAIFETAETAAVAAADGVAEPMAEFDSLEALEARIKDLEQEMHAAARNLDFEKAAGLRDRVRALRGLQVFDL